MLNCIPNCYKTQEILQEAVSKESFVSKYCLYQYKSQEMRKEQIDACLPLSKFVPEWFFSNETLKDIDTAVFVNDDIFVVADTDTVTFFTDFMGLFNVDLNNVSFDDDNFDNGDPKTIIHVRLMAWCKRKR